MADRPGAAYYRVSTITQKERHSTEAQEATVPRLAKAHGYVLLESYQDEGISGSTLEDRPGALRLLDEVERGAYEAVFVTEIDRLARPDRADWELLKAVFRKGHCKLITEKQIFDFSDEDQEFQSDLFSLLAAYESKKIRRRAVRGKITQIQKGKWVGGRRHYGYTHDEDKNIVPKEDEARVYRMMVDWCINGQGLGQIAASLQSLGVPTPSQGKSLKNRSPKWRISTVQRILRNPAYTGTYYVQRWSKPMHQQATIRPRAEWIQITGNHALITEEEFALVQEALTKRKVLSKRNAKRDYLLSGLIYCVECGCRMTGETWNQHRGDGSRMYICWNARRKVKGTPCPVKNVPATDIEMSVWEMVEELIQDLEVLKAKIRESHGLNHTAEQMKDLLALLKTKETEEERLLDLYQHGTLTIGKLTNRLESVRKERETIEQNLELLKKRTTFEAQLDRLDRLTVILAGEINGDTGKRRQLLTELLDGGRNGCGIFLNKDNHIDIRGVIDFNKINDGIVSPTPKRKRYNTSQAASFSCSSIFTRASRVRRTRAAA